MNTSTLLSPLDPLLRSPKLPRLDATTVRASPLLSPQASHFPTRSPAPLQRRTPGTPKPWKLELDSLLPSTQLHPRLRSTQEGARGRELKEIWRKTLLLPIEKVTQTSVHHFDFSLLYYFTSHRSFGSLVPWFLVPLVVVSL